MMKQGTVKRKSLRWRWATVSSSAFIMLYMVFSLFFLHWTREVEYRREKDYSVQYVDKLVGILSQPQFQLDGMSLQTFFKQDSPLAFELNVSGIDVRLIDSHEKVFYETKPMPYMTFQKKDLNKVMDVRVEQRQGIAMSKELKVSSTGELKGYAQFIFHLNTFHARMDKMKQTYIFITLIAVCSSVILGHLLAYVFFKPIQHMTEVMALLKEDALSKKRMHLSARRQDELTELSIGFNDLLDTMELYIDQQKQFVEDVSHELRTPVAVVEGHLKLLNRWGKDDPVVLEESLHASLLEIERMKTLVQEMLDLSRAEQVSIHYKNDLTEIVSVLEQVYQNFQLIYPQFHFNLDNDIHLDNNEVWVGIARHHIEQVLIILLDNAVKYSTTRNQVNISIANTITNVQISVQDYGEGITEENIQKIFGRFYRVDKARSRYKGGNGLGLSIAKELVEGYKGQISVESVSGSGSTFRISFPIITDHARVIQEKRKVKQQQLMQNRGEL